MDTDRTTLPQEGHSGNCDLGKNHCSRVDRLIPFVARFTFGKVVKFCGSDRFIAKIRLGKPGPES